MGELQKHRNAKKERGNAKKISYRNAECEGKIEERGGLQERAHLCKTLTILIYLDWDSNQGSRLSPAVSVTTPLRHGAR